MMKLEAMMKMKLEKWKKENQRIHIECSDSLVYQEASARRCEQALKSITCGENCGYDENNCPVPVRFCNCCINREYCACKNKETDEHLSIKKL